MTETNNLHLPQWEDTDRIMRTDFNDAMANIDTALKAANDAAAAAPKVAYGSYKGTGDGGASITFSFVPRFLSIRGTTYVAASALGTSGNWDIIYCNSSNTQVAGTRVTYSVSGNTFSINSANAALGMNQSNQTYWYLAIG